jgi:hypothetical protein
LALAPQVRPPFSASSRFCQRHCRLNEPVIDGRSQRPVTFAKDIAPIFQKACGDLPSARLDRADVVMTYDAARPWARSIKQRVQSREIAALVHRSAHRHSALQRRSVVSDDEIALIAKWCGFRRAAGRSKDMPPPLPGVDIKKWDIGEPDLIVGRRSTRCRDRFRRVVGPVLRHRSERRPLYQGDSDFKPDSVASYKVVAHAHQYMVDANLAGTRPGRPPTATCR